MQQTVGTLGKIPPEEIPADVRNQFLGHGFAIGNDNGYANHIADTPRDARLVPFA